MKPLAAFLLLLTTSALAATGDEPAVTLHGHRFSTEFATSEAAREQGLMNRKTLAADHSMLFVFGDSTPRWFWMKNMLLALDILYFDEDRKLVAMQLDVPPCRNDPCPSYPSEVAARYVLELPAGTARRLGARDGDVLSIEGAIGAVE